MAIEYYLVKATRNSNEPYCGPTSDYKPAVYQTRTEALDAMIEFTRRNPVGWDIKEREVD